MTIREGVEADAPAMAEVNAAGWREGYEGIVDREVLRHRLPVAQWKRDMAAGLRSPRLASFTWIAELDDQVCGYCFVAAPGRQEPDDSKLAELVAMYVRRYAWRRGVGTKLMNASLGRTTEAGFDEIFLWTFEANKRAIAFYERHGFEPDGQKRPYLPHNIPTIRMRRALPQ